MPAVMSTTVTDEQKQQFRDEGYFILERAVPPDLLEILRSCAQYAIDKVHREMDARGTDSLGGSYRNKRYFATGIWKDRPQLRQFLFSDLMADVCRATLGEDACLFYEQYVIKSAEQGMKFSWHQDSGYVHPFHKPYLTCWIPLDDVNEENGTVYLLPYSRAGIRTYVQHVRDPESNDMVGYFGSDRGIPVIVPAGSIACFSSYVFHCSGANRTSRARRVYLAQYSGEVILDVKGENPWAEFEPFLKGGRNVARHDPRA